MGKKVIPIWKDELDFSECDSRDSACVDYIAQSGAADFFAKKAVDKAGYATSVLINYSVALGPIFVCSILFFIDRKYKK